MFDFFLIDNFTPHPSPQDHWIWYFNLVPCNHGLHCHNHFLPCHYNPPLLFEVFNLWFLACMQWCFQDVPPMSCKIWLMTRYLFQKSNFCQLFSMGMSYLNCCQCFLMLTTLRICKAWTTSMMAMFGVKWSQLISKIVLGRILGKLVA